MITRKKDLEEFQKQGLMKFTNSFLRMMGWSFVYKNEKGKGVSIYLEKLKDGDKSLISENSNLNKLVKECLKETQKINSTSVEKKYKRIVCCNSAGSRAILEKISCEKYLIFFGSDISKYVCIGLKTLTEIEIFVELGFPGSYIVGCKDDGGLFKTVDYGKHWKLLSCPFDLINVSVNSYVYFNETTYILTTSGLYSFDKNGIFEDPCNNDIGCNVIVDSMKIFKNDDYHNDGSVRYYCKIHTSWNDTLVVISNDGRKWERINDTFNYEDFDRLDKILSNGIDCDLFKKIGNLGKYLLNFYDVLYYSNDRIVWSELLFDTDKRHGNTDKTIYLDRCSKRIYICNSGKNGIGYSDDKCKTWENILPGINFYQILKNDLTDKLLACDVETNNLHVINIKE